MIRDRGPLQSLGNGISSRDIPVGDGETEGVSQDSGMVSKALNGHPVMRFFAHMGTTVLVAGVGAAMLKKGGLKLAEKLETHGSTSLVKDMIDIRKHLDALQGVKRMVDGVNDPYEKLVYKIGDELTNGYMGGAHSAFGYSFTKNELRQAGRGLTSEPASIWAFKEEMQQRMIRAGRRMPYELPALWGAQKAVTDPLFGNNDKRKKVNWYNPADVLTDFVKTSVNNIATMVLPGEVLGGTVNAAKSSLNTFQYSMDSLSSLSPLKQKVAKGYLDLTDILSEVGHDAMTAGNAFLKKSAQTSGAFSSAAKAMGADEQPKIVQALHDARRGATAAYRASAASKDPGLKRATIYAKSLAFGVNDGVGLIDSIPALRGLSSGIRVGRQQFRVFGEAYDALENSIAHGKLLAASSPGTHAESVISAMQKIQSQYSDRLSKFAIGTFELSGGGPDSKSFSRSEFFIGQQNKEYKELLSRRLIAKGIDEKEANNFVTQLKTNVPGPQTNASNTVSIGKTGIHEEGEGYFGEILKRFRNIKGGKEFNNNLFELAKNNNQSPEKFFQNIVEETNTYFSSREFKKSIATKIGNQWNAFAKNDIVDFASIMLKPQKAVYQDFVGPLTSAKKEFLQRKTAQALGIPLNKMGGGLVSNDAIKSGLANRGLDPHNFNDLRSFLVRNKKMTSGIFEGNLNILGIRPMLISEAIEKGKFKHLKQGQQNVIGSLAGRMATSDPVSRSIGFSKLGGVYQSKSGQVLDFNAVKTTFSKVANFFASELQVPIIKINPADMFGYRSFAQMAKNGPLQYSPGMTVQPFGELEGSTADFHMWHSTRGTKGKITSYFADSQSGEISSKTLKGTYRPLPTQSMEMLSRQARFASGLNGESVTDIGEIGSKRSRRFKNAMDVDAEQPNSLLNLFSRFRKRSYDINNPSVTSRLLSGEEVLIKEGGERKSVKLDKVDGKYSLVDNLGKPSNLYNESQILQGIESFERGAFGYGFDNRIMSQLESEMPETFTIGGLGRISSIKTPQQAEEYAQRLGNMIPMLKAQAKAKGLDSSFITKSYSRIENILKSDISGMSGLNAKSSTISTRVDELKNEIFRYVSQTNAALGNGGSSVDQMFINIQTVLQQLKKTLPASKFAEAQAAALSTLFNLSAFTTYKQSAESIENSRAAVTALMERLNSTAGAGAKKLFDPFTKGTIASVNTGVKKPFSSLVPFGKKIFGTAPHITNNLGVDPFGSGQKITFAPTFGTAFDKNPIGALKSALGIGTYKNPSNYSTGSTAVSQGVERLNRYFGTLGGQLDVSKYNGPLDLYMRGMVGKRVLPLYAAGVTALTIDRTIGGAANGKDKNGQRIYSPFFTTKAARGVVEARSIVSGISPGGMTFQQKKEQLTEGVVPIRQGRFWPLGNTPLKGGKVNYYRPSWYKRLEAGAMFTSDTYESPMEKFLYYNDISPLRPLDPYRFEKKHYQDRPYPVTGEYFTGPFGPAVPILNATLGKILKPQKIMHGDELTQGLSNYVSVGQSGAYDSSAYISGSIGGGSLGFGGGSGNGGGGFSGGAISGVNAGYSRAAGNPRNTASVLTQGSIAGLNAPLAQMAYGPTKQRGIMPPPIVAASAPISSGSMQLGEFGYRTQEMAGIYGFGFSSLREKFGFGQKDFQPNKSTLQSASKAYGSSRSFWDLNLGGAGDVPLPTQGALGNLEFSEIVRRFIPKERTGIDYINPIKNTMGQQYPFLPGSEYFTDFQRGDPFTKVQEGELRLPGVGYERMHNLNSDSTGKYGLLDQLSILADVAPYSDQFKKINSSIDSQNLSPDQKIKVEEIRARLAETTKKYNFTPYKYKGKTASEMGISSAKYNAGRTMEYLAHRDTLFNTKFLQNRTAQEDWERRNVYGATFPEWQKPYQSFIKPMIQKASDRNPIAAAGMLSVIGSTLGRTPKAKALSGGVGAVVGLSSSLISNLKEKITGERYIPKTRKKELALEEYSDMLTYVKYSRLASMAKQSGNGMDANQYTQAAQRTMYGADIYGAPIDTLSLAIPKRKREHFAEMIKAPESDRKQILSTSGRLERRIYEAAWGMPVEDRPDLGEYFAKHELPDMNWEGWNPSTNMDHVKIKIGQNMGLEMSQMGYYPQQLREANLSNPSFPQFSKQENKGNILQKLRSLLNGSGVSGTVTPVMNPFGSSGIDISAGVR